MPCEHEVESKYEDRYRLAVTAIVMIPRGPYGSSVGRVAYFAYIIDKFMFSESIQTG